MKENDDNIFKNIIESSLDNYKLAKSMSKSRDEKYFIKSWLFRNK